jgi:hypothetical protein
MSARDAIGLAAATIAILAVAAPAVASTDTYKGGGKSAFKDTITLRASLNKVLSYDVNIETLCGEVNVGGNQTVVWPVTPNAGEAPLTIRSNGSFSGKQHQSTTIPAIHNVTAEPAPGTYSFSISGKLNRAKSRIEGHVSLKIETSTGYFCTVSNSPFTAKKQ